MQTAEMVNRQELLSALNHDWLVHRYDPDQDCFHFRAVTREQRRAAPFLTDEYLGQDSQPLVLPANEAQLIGGRSGLHYIFHSAYCCSTVLANALDATGFFSSFKEPVVLNDLVGWRHRGGMPDRVGQRLSLALKLLSRPLTAEQDCVVKPSNAVNGLATAMMTLQPGAKAILLYAPLPDFLASIARKGMWGRLWVRELLALQLKDGLIELGFEARDHLLHTDLQTAAVGWLAQQKLFSLMADQWPERVRTMNSEALIADPAGAVAACCRFFDRATLEIPRVAEVRMVFEKNAKDGSTFKAGQRADNAARGASLHADEIEKVTVWAQRVAQTVSIPLDLGNSLTW